MNVEQFEKLMQPVIDFNNESDGFNENFSKLGDDVGFVSLGNKLLDSYIELLSTKMGTDLKLNENHINEWISWWVFENRMGEGGLTAKAKEDDELKEIITVSDLFDIIVR